MPHHSQRPNRAVTTPCRCSLRQRLSRRRLPLLLSQHLPPCRKPRHRRKMTRLQHVVARRCARRSTSVRRLRSHSPRQRLSLQPRSRHLLQPLHRPLRSKPSRAKPAGGHASSAATKRLPTQQRKAARQNRAAFLVLRSTADQSVVIAVSTSDGSMVLLRLACIVS